MLPLKRWVYKGIGYMKVGSAELPPGLRGDPPQTECTTDQGLILITKQEEKRKGALVVVPKAKPKAHASFLAAASASVSASPAASFFAGFPSRPTPGVEEEEEEESFLGMRDEGEGDDYYDPLGKGWAVIAIVTVL